MRGLRQRVILIACLLLLLGAAAAVPPAAQAAPSFHLHTAFPGISVQPGETVTVPVEVENRGTSDGVASLQVVEKPRDWQVDVQGSSWIVQQVRVLAGNSENVRLQVKVPANAAEGNYPIRLQANGDGSAAVLALTMRVSKQEGAAAELVSQYPMLQGPSNAEFTFRVTLNNETPEQQLYALTAEAPEGWRVELTSTGQDTQIASLSLDANSSQSINVRVHPAENAVAGEYKIPVRASSSRGSASAELTVVITGSYQLELTTPSGRLNAEATAGRASTFTAQVNNKGTTDLHGLSFSSTVPTNWKVSFEPDSLDLLAAGESREINVTVEPDRKAIAGDYVMQLTAQAQEASDSAEFRVMVKTSTLWGWLGVLIVLAVIAGVYTLFRIYGRR